MNVSNMRIISAALLLIITACSTPAPSSVSVAPEPVLPQWTPTPRLADSALAGGAPGLALQINDQLLAKNPRDADSWTRRGNALAALDRNAEAAESFTAALQLQPRNTKALLGLGRIRLQPDPAAAEALFAQVMVLDPQNAAAICNLGVARDLQGHHAAAQEAYRMALGIAPSSVPAQVNLGLSLALSGDTDGAVRLLKPLATGTTAAPRIRHGLALALSLAGRRREASAALGPELTSDQIRTALDGFEALRR